MVYSFLAMHSLYLGSAMVHELEPDESHVVPNSRLRGGNADNSPQIDIADLACIGGAFGGPPATCGGSPCSDTSWDVHP